MTIRRRETMMASGDLLNSVSLFEDSPEEQHVIGEISELVEYYRRELVFDEGDQYRSLK